MAEYGSYGYFFNWGEPNEGKYLLLPNGHNAPDRIAAQKGAGIEYENCALFYSRDGGLTYLPFSLKEDDPITLVLDKDSRFALWVNHHTYQPISQINNIVHFHDLNTIERYHENIKFNNAKEWLKTKYPDLKIEIIDKGNYSNFCLTVQLSKEKAYSVHNPDLIAGIIQLYQELAD